MPDCTESLSTYKYGLEEVDIKHTFDKVSHEHLDPLWPLCPPSQLVRGDYRVLRVLV